MGIGQAIRPAVQQAAQQLPSATQPQPMGGKGVANTISQASQPSALQQPQMSQPTTAGVPMQAYQQPFQQSPMAQAPVQIEQVVPQQQVAPQPVGGKGAISQAIQPANPEQRSMLQQPQPVGGKGAIGRGAVQQPQPMGGKGVRQGIREPSNLRGLAALMQSRRMR